MGHTKDLLQEDWEREHDKDFLYLLEEKMRIEAEYYNRKPAEIIVVNELKKKENNEAEHNTLPF
jgi:hypothetical protein